ncbi:M16 family metallopeptidase [Parasphingorhabdus sp. DH2-15]|uniref:M16 family metallopeptidase n=1 Tax=Parasphingorhabdus sp. DH2-15 TaxID=3444112 RepID=UPI003F688521
MILFHRAKAISVSLAIAALFTTIPASAQRENPLPPPENVDNEQLPWLYQNSDIPVDPAWTFGELKNGVRYAVRKNGVPPGQVTIRIRVDAGSLMETDKERGFAHLLEHLTFRGSKYVPDGEAIRIWQRFGITFGSDSNAETSATHTVYKLDIPSASAETLDESMQILSGMIREPSLSAEGLNAERPVVLAELRERSGTQARIADATRQLFFAGQRYADRSPIGTVETLNGATPEAVRAFHSRWYRPENTVIVIAGDADPAVFEQLLTKYFDDWKVAGKTPEHPDFGKPSADKPTADVLVEPTLPFIINQAVIRPWNYVNDTIEYNEGLLADLLALQIINRELERRARGGGSYLQASVSQDDVSRSIDSTFISIVPIGEDWRAALNDVRAVIDNARKTPFSEEDIAREVSEFDAALKIGVDTYETEAATQQADNIVNAVDIREASAAPQVALDVFNSMKTRLTPEFLRKRVDALFTGTATRALLIAPEEGTVSRTELASALTAKIRDAGASKRRANVTFDDLPAPGKPGTVAGIEDIGLLGMQIVTFENGARALLYPNDAEVNKITLRLRFGGGYQTQANDKSSLLWAGESALISSGIADLRQEDLDQLTTGRRISFGFSIKDDAFEFSADTRSEDLKDQLRLFVAKLVEPGWDPAPVVRTKAGSKLSYQSYTSAPSSLIDRDLGWLLRGRDPRYKTPDPQELDKLNAKSFRKTWEPLLKEGPIEVLLFGDFDQETAIQYLAETVGAMPARKPAKIATNGGALGVPVLAPSEAAIISRHRGDAGQAAALIAWPTSGGFADIRESRRLEILATVFNNRLFEQLRAKEGASYAPQVYSSWPKGYSSGGYIGAISQLAPSAVPVFEQTARDIAKDLIANPVTADELNRAVVPLGEQIRRAATGNTFWIWQLEGATQDSRRIDAIRTLLGDYTRITPAEVQLLAQKYLATDRVLRWHILPEASGDD